LKGIHLILDSWRPWRKSNGWKLTLSKIRIALEEKGQATGGSPGSGDKAPERVTLVLRLKEDIRALQMFMSSKTPPKCIIQHKREATVIYSFGDASGCGFGSSMKMFTTYVDSGMKNTRRSSQGWVVGRLRSVHFLQITVQQRQPFSIFKGISFPQKLLNLILWLQYLPLHGRMMIHFIHVAGKRIS
jgi:hypothetical protein